jgi:predicted aspartyl protease
MAQRGIDRRLFGVLLASGAVFARGARSAIIDLDQDITRLAPPGGPAGRPYSPPTTLSTVADIYSRMTAPVRVNGAGPFPFVVDTGANQSVVSGELVAQLGLSDGPPSPLNGVAGVDIAPTTKASLAFGGWQTPEATLAVLPQAAIGGPGMLGLDRLEGDQLTLDFKGQALRIDSGRRILDQSRDMKVLAHRRNGQLILVDVDIAGIPLTAFLDSGAQNTIGNLALRSLAINRHPSNVWLSTPIVSATGQTISAEMAELPHLRIGGMSLPNWPVAFADLHTFRMWDLIDKPAILIGVDLLSRFESVCLDFARNEVRFRRPDQSI